MQPAGAVAQSWKTQASNTAANLRGISAVNKQVAWASGTGGTFVRTVDGGEHWQAGVVPGAEQLDFRDVEAFSDRTAMLLAIGPGERSRIYGTEDGGAHWTMLMQNANPKAFWDCMAWWDAKHGIVVGDPVNGNFELLITTDGGQTWINGEAPAKANEGAFAASGSCIAVEGAYREIRQQAAWQVEARAWFVTGGAAARVFASSNAGATWAAATPPMLSGPASAGAFSVAFADANNGVIVGGDYQQPGEARGNVAVSRDGGASWSRPKGLAPRGFRAAVAYDRDAKMFVTVGTTGSELSRNGDSWQPVDSENYNALSFAPDGGGWAVGPQGKIVVWVPLPHHSRFRPRLP